jgi:cardiolipin synthase
MSVQRRRASSAQPWVIAIAIAGAAVAPVSSSAEGINMPPRPETGAPTGEAAGRARLRPALEALAGVPFTSGNRVDVLRNGDETFAALVAAIGEATRTIDMLWFAWRSGGVSRQVAAALSAAARRGLRVRILLDGFGAKGAARAEITGLRSAGCDVSFYRPLPSARPTVWNLRSHRRVLVCDECVGFTGGTGIADAWVGDAEGPHEWRDTAFRLRGPAVAGLRSAFVSAWLQTQAHRPGDLLSDEDRFPALVAEGRTAVQVLRPASQPGWNDAAVAVTALLHGAQSRVRISTPYVRLPPWLRGLVQAAAERGVAVQLLVSGPYVERRSVHLQGELDFQPLLEAGVEIWQYQAGLFHPKIITVDRTVAMVGTANLDARSLALNEQVCLVLEDQAVVGVLDTHYEEDLRVSNRIRPDEWPARGLRRRALEIASDVTGRPLRGWGAVGLTGRWP